MKIILRFLIIAMMLFIVISVAQARELKQHTVIKKDTLWDISSHELNNPFMWPKIWMENLWIKDPDLIFPGQVLKIPIYLRQASPEAQEMVPETQVAEEAVQPVPDRRYESTVPERAAIPPARQELAGPRVDVFPISQSKIISSGYLSDTIPGVGRIEGAPSGRDIFGNTDELYIQTDFATQSGNRFYAVRVVGPVAHPITGRDIGYVVTIRGILQVLRTDDAGTTAMVTRCFGDMQVGDRLVPYYEIPAPPTQPFRSPDVNGMIIAAANKSQYQVRLDVVYIDRGSQHGVAPGDTFRTIEVKDRPLVNGTIRIISVKETTSTAIIIRSTGPISAGNIFAKTDRP